MGQDTDDIVGCEGIGDHNGASGKQVGASGKQVGASGKQVEDFVEQ